MIPRKTVAATVLGATCGILVLFMLSVSFGTVTGPTSQDTSTPSSLPPIQSYHYRNMMGQQQVLNTSSSTPYILLTLEASWPVLAVLSSGALGLGLLSMLVISKGLSRTREELEKR